MFVYRRSSDGAVFLLQLALSGAAAERQRVSRSGSVSQISGVMMSRSASQSDVSAPPSAAASNATRRASRCAEISFESGREPESPNAAAAAAAAAAAPQSPAPASLTAAAALAAAAGAPASAPRLSAASEPAAVELRVMGLDAPGDEIVGSGSLALAQHLRHQLDELTLRALIVLLQRTPESRLSAADLRFLRPPGAPPPRHRRAAAAVVARRRRDGVNGNLESTAQAPMLAWLRAAGGGCGRWAGTRSHSRTPPARARRSALLHLPPAPTRAAASGRRAAVTAGARHRPRIARRSLGISSCPQGPHLRLHFPR